MGRGIGHRLPAMAPARVHAPPEAQQRRWSALAAQIEAVSMGRPRPIQGAPARWLCEEVLTTSLQDARRYFYPSEDALREAACRTFILFSVEGAPLIRSGFLYDLDDPVDATRPIVPSFALEFEDPSTGPVPDPAFYAEQASLIRRDDLRGLRDVTGTADQIERALHPGRHLAVRASPSMHDEATDLVARTFSDLAECRRYLSEAPLGLGHWAAYYDLADEPVQFLGATRPRRRSRIAVTWETLDGPVTARL